MRDQAWKEKAKCVGLDPTTIEDTFFISAQTRPTLAREFCKDCSVKIECLQYAITYNCKGIWGGLTEAERYRMVERNWFSPGKLKEDHVIANHIGSFD